MQLNKNMYKLLILLTLGYGCIGMQISAKAQAQQNPNIVLILADDLGYGDVHCYNSGSTIPTPAMDRLAKEGIMFTDAHTPSAVCTPTRYGLLCGRYAWRTRLQSGVLSGYSPTLIEAGRQTLASVLQDKGYQTAVVGKWHLGLDWPWVRAVPDGVKGLNYVPPAGYIDYAKPVKQGANEVGFAYSYVIPGSLDMGPYVYMEDGKATQIPNQEFEGKGFPAYVRKGEIAGNFSHVDALDHLVNKAQNFIETHAKTRQPFFLYFPLTAPHKPVLPHPRFEGKSGLGPHGDFIMQTDWTVGEILKTLDKAGITKETLVIFTSDNGSYMFEMEPGQKDHTEDATVQGYRPEHHRANGNWRGTKADIYEGGHRVPFLIRWPEQWKGNQSVDETICLTDVMATVSEIVGVEIDTTQSEDTYSFYPVLQNGKSILRPPVVHHSVNGTFGLREGNYKLIFSNGSGGRQKPAGEVFGNPYQLYNLGNDPQETRNLVSTDQQVAGSIEKELEVIRNKSNNDE